MSLVVVFASIGRKDLKKLKSITHDMPAKFEQWLQEQTWIDGEWI